MFGNPTLGDAILDRIIHNAHRIELKGDSLRRSADQKKRARPLPNPTIVPPAHRTLPRAALRRSWGPLRATRGSLPWTAGTISTVPPVLTRRPFPGQHQIVSCVRRRVDAQQCQKIHPEHDHDHLETVITIAWNR